MGGALTEWSGFCRIVFVFVNGLCLVVPIWILAAGNGGGQASIWFLDTQPYPTSCGAVASRHARVRKRCPPCSGGVRCPGQWGGAKLRSRRKSKGIFSCRLGGSGIGFFFRMFVDLTALLPTLNRGCGGTEGKGRTKSASTHRHRKETEENKQWQGGEASKRRKGGITHRKQHTIEGIGKKGRGDGSMELSRPRSSFPAG